MLITMFTVLFVLICPLLVVIVLIQDPKGGGLAGVLGGAGGTSAFGARTADVVTKVTVGLGVLFFALALLLGFALKSEEAVVPSIQETPAESAAPATVPVTPAPAAGESSAPASAAPASVPATPAPAAGETSAPASGAPAPIPANTAPAPASGGSGGDATQPDAPVGQPQGQGS